MEFSSLPIHDAVLYDVHVHWRAATCCFILGLVGVEQQHELAFAGVTKLVVPKNEPWGPSIYVNAVRSVELGCYEIEMQSGDIIQVRATSFQFGLQHESARLSV